MNVVQRNKNKVRTVLDFREMNTHIDTFTVNSDVCASKIREWRRRGTSLSILDLKKAYLQIRVGESLWPYQTVIFHGRRYCLTRLGFGLNVTPTIMKALMDRVLSLSANIRKATSAYLDDILVGETVVSAETVSKYLAQHGLHCKAPE
uniref:Reverse transcriptase domain-containing protein n=1 Tax=Trichuris muris TaxID=70415 RepID=A0A5S6QMM8_TRIMR